MAELPPGSVVAGCRVEAVAGRGGMGVVYRATQLSLDRPVALKAIAPELTGDVTFRERFKRESRIAASIEHPNVIPVYEAGEGDGLLYLIMRYVEGTDLRALIDAGGALDPERAARILAQVAAALAAAHRRGLIHRDVKPANVLIDPGGDHEHAYLTDFGIARHTAATSGLTRTGSVIGTLDYLAPERIEEQSGDGRSDVYALGCVLYEALTGSVPYRRDTEVAKLFAHLNAPTPSARDAVPGVPVALDELARRAMAKDPDERFATAADMAASLRETLPAGRTRPASAPPGPAPETMAAPRTEAAPEPPTPEPPTPGPTAPEPTAAPTRPTQRRRPALLAAAAAVVATVVLVLALSLSGGESPDEDAGGRASPAGGGGSADGAGRPEPPPGFRLAGQAALAPGPDGLAVGAGTVWVANKRTGHVIPVDESGATAGTPIRVGANPDSVAVGFGSVWVTNTDDDDVSRIDPEQGVTAQRIPVGDGPEGIAISEDAVWVANGTGGSVTRIPAAGGTPTTAGVGAGPVQIAISRDDRVWVTLADAQRVVELDRDTGEPVGRSVRVPGQPRGIAFDGERLWVAATSGGYLGTIDPDRPRLTRAAELRGPREIRFGLGAVWVTTGSNQRLVVLDPSTGEPIRSFPVGPLTYGLAVGDRFAWAASEGSGRLLKVRPRG